MLVKVLLGLIGLVVVFLIVVATRPTGYHVERTIEIAAPPDTVFGVLNDLHRFAGVLVMFGTPWEQIDPGMQRTFEGPADGAGQSYAWNSRKDLGSGKMTIDESVPGQKVGITLAFEKPMKSTSACVLTVSGTPAGSLVTWSMAGNHNFLGKAIGVFMNMDGMLGSDIDKGLARLKTAAEGGPR